MSARGNRLQATANRQIAQLLELIETLDEETARRPCPGREKLGDGTVAASARHAAENYGRIAAFLMTSQPASAAHAPPKHDFQRGAHPDNNAYTADHTDLVAVARQLSSTRDTIGRIGHLTDRELDAIPSAGTFRFCDGRRTLEQVLARLLNHQGHQLDALKAAVE